MIREGLDGDRVWVIHDFLSGEECAALIRRSDGLTYQPGLAPAAHRRASAG
jgi:hypothetical protein